MNASRQHRTFSSVLAILLAAGCAVPAAASELYVAASGNDANDCRSPGTPCLTLQAAVNKSGDGDNVNIGPGTFAGALIPARRNFQLIGNSTTIAGAPTSANDLIDISYANSLTLRSLVIQATLDNDAIRVFYSNGVQLIGCTVEQADQGIFVNAQSQVTIQDSLFQNNGVAIRVDGNSNLDLSSTPFTPGVTTVQNNGIGVYVRSGVLNVNGATVISGNSTGILDEGGNVKTCCDIGQRKIMGNVVGIILRSGSLFLIGPVLVQNNSAAGISVNGGGYARLSQQVRIKNNGNGIESYAGVVNMFGSAAGDIQITNNTADGVVATHDAALSVAGPTITGNHRDGVRLESLSSASFDVKNKISANTGADLDCLTHSFADGKSTGIVNMTCPDFNGSGNP